MIISRLFTFMLLITTLFFYSCDSVSTNSGSNDQGDVINDDSSGGSENSDWLIPEDQIFVGAGRDAIPSIDDPSFKPVNEITFLEDDELILGLKIGDEIRGYPHQILNYHEIVNDMVDNIPVAVTFCPLTGSGIAWSRTINGQETTFGVSGLIHKNNLIAYDRATNNFWSQMKQMSVNGSLKAKKTDSYQIIEMNWQAWKKVYPEAMVLSGETGFDRNYETPPYGRNYNNDNENIIFPIHREDDRLERKTLVHGFVNGLTLYVFPIEYFPDEILVMNRNIGDNHVVIAGNSKDDMVISYSSVMTDGTRLNFSSSEKELPVLMEDDEGNEWNLFGECISGPREGEILKRIRSYNAYWFAWVDFFGEGPRSPFIVFP